MSTPTIVMIALGLAALFLIGLLIWDERRSHREENEYDPFADQRLP